MRGKNTNNQKGNSYCTKMTEHPVHILSLSSIYSITIQCIFYHYLVHIIHTLTIQYILYILYHYLVHIIHIISLSSTYYTYSLTIQYILYILYHYLVHILSLSSSYYITIQYILYHYLVHIISLSSSYSITIQHTFYYYLVHILSLCNKNYLPGRVNDLRSSHYAMFNKEH